MIKKHTKQLKGKSNDILMSIYFQTELKNSCIKDKAIVYNAVDVVNWFLNVQCYRKIFLILGAEYMVFVLKSVDCFQ